MLVSKNQKNLANLFLNGRLQEYIGRSRLEFTLSVYRGVKIHRGPLVYDGPSHSDTKESRDWLVTVNLQPMLFTSVEDVASFVAAVAMEMQRNNYEAEPLPIPAML